MRFDPVIMEYAEWLQIPETPESDQKGVETRVEVSLLRSRILKWMKWMGNISVSTFNFEKESR